MLRIIAALLLLTACTNTVQAPSFGGYRAGQTPIYSTAGLPMARLAGTWHQVAGFGAKTPCTARPSLTVAAQNGAPFARYDLCFGNQRRMGAGPITSAGAQGRYMLQGSVTPLWVLWIDEGNRTMALGTPDGSFGMIVSKDAPPADRLRAAREVLAWNGYDLTQFYQY